MRAKIATTTSRSSSSRTTSCRVDFPTGFLCSEEFWVGLFYVHMQYRMNRNENVLSQWQYGFQ